ncbi:hypothetical protein GGR57DRAFT_440109 [Xylariaceae sp. FL1272]|nr:hypothetical protein GGR57DRAFT_440109 [Xylariaceae sp. FL1272]
MLMSSTKSKTQSKLPPKSKSRLGRLFLLFSPLTASPAIGSHGTSQKPFNSEPNDPERKYTLPPLSPEVDLSLDGGTKPPRDDGVNRNSEEDNTLPATRSPGRLQKPPPPSHPPPPVPPPGTTDFDFTRTETESSARLQKEQKRRSSSVNASPKSRPRTPSVLKPKQGSPPSECRGRSASAQPQHRRSIPEPGNRVASSTAAPSAPRGASSNDSQSPTRDGERPGRLRRSWLPGGRSRSVSQSTDPARQNKLSAAWVLGQRSDYNTAFLANGEKVPELWNESGQVLIYLDPKGIGATPSFKVAAFVTDYSLVFADLVEAEMAASPASTGRHRARSFTGRDSLSVSDAHRVQSPPLGPSTTDSADDGETRLYLPVSMSTPGHRSEADMERLISIRNMFAFLTGQPLVATKSQPTLFAVFLNIAGLLKEYEFTNVDGSTFGSAVEMSFSFFMEQMGLADVRHSREKTLESLILGERMRSMELYNEAFSHAVGKYAAMRDLRSPLWDQVSPSARQRLERAHIELVSRQHSVNTRLEAFEFPALFTGTASSTSFAEYKDIKFNTWKKSFGRMRQFVLGFYKTNFGNWPPKARSKKNPFTESGLNRQVLKILYSDFCALYDLVADRESLTTRVIDDNAGDITDDGLNPRASALRKVLGEFDQSSPPVLPPVPFDLPMMPNMATVQENYYELSIKEQSKLDKGLQEYQIRLILNKAYDFETDKLRIPFLEQFQEFELKEAKGKTAIEMTDQRLGYWLFLYVVIQSLPMLVVDAPGLNHTEAVEYFLCQPPKGSPPWMEDAPAVRKRWYEVAGGGGLVELSEDAVTFGVEGIYHRSHCWLAAKRWEGGQVAEAPLPHETVLSPLAAPKSVFEDMDPNTPPVARSESPLGGPSGLALRPRGISPAGRQPSYRSSIALGLEPVVLPPGERSLTPTGRNSPAGTRPPSGAMGRSRSSGNLQGLAGFASIATGSGSRSNSRQGFTSGSTFDEILKNVEIKQPKKKRVFFLNIY